VHYVVAGIFSLFVIALGIGAVTGRVRASSCCAPGDPALDARIRAASEDLDARMRAASEERPGPTTGSPVSQDGAG